MPSVTDTKVANSSSLRHLQSTADHACSSDANLEFGQACMYSVRSCGRRLQQRYSDVLGVLERVSAGHPFHNQSQLTSHRNPDVVASLPT